MKRAMYVLHATFLSLLLTGAAAAQGQGGVGNITVQLPTFGIAVDAQGVLQVQEFADPTGQLRRARQDAARNNLAADVLAPSKLRKVSLPRLERAIRAQLAAGKPIDDVQLHLAGLQQVQFVFCYPDTGDIVLAGPAEGWIDDPAGRSVGLTTGRPVCLLADLAVALGAYPAGKQRKTFVGCTIDPPAAGLVRLQAFQKQIPHVVPQTERQRVAETIARGIHDSLSLADIRVFGIAAETHFAQILIEADYRMKLIGIGLERPPIRLASFLDLSNSGSAGTLQRWWFTPNYDCVRVTDDRLGMQLVGEGVQLLCENKLVGEDGRLAAGALPNRASELFTQGFTQNFPELAARSPVFAQLRMLIDLLVVAAYLERHDLYAQARWTPAVFADERLLPVRTLKTPAQVQSVVNVVWKGNRLLSPAGGGVSIRADQALDPEHVLKDDRGRVKTDRQKVGEAIPPDRWWWD